MAVEGYGLGAWGIDPYGDPLWWELRIVLAKPELDIEGTEPFDETMPRWAVAVSLAAPRLELDPGPDVEPAGVQRVNIKRVSATMPAPTLTDGRPTA